MNINVAMIGASGSGKTSFMSGLYHYFFNNRKDQNHGFGMQVIGAGGNSAPEVAIGAFAQAASVVEEGEFPNGTVGSTHYGFGLTHSGNNICTFNWMDYRGGAVEEAVSGASSFADDYKDIRNAIDNAHAVAVFIDALQLTEYKADFRSRNYSGISVVNRLISALGADYKKGKHITVLFVLTKCDASTLKKEWTDNNYYLLIEKAKRLLSPALDTIEQCGWKCGIVPTGVVGAGNVKTNAVGHPEEGRVRFMNKIVNDPQPFNQNNSLFYLLGSVLANSCKQDAAQVQNLKLEAERAIAQKGIVKDFIRKFNGDLTSDQIAKIKADEITELQSSLLKHERKINEMYIKSTSQVRILTPW